MRTCSSVVQLRLGSGYRLGLQRPTYSLLRLTAAAVKKRYAPLGTQAGWLGLRKRIYDTIGDPVIRILVVQTDLGADSESSVARLLAVSSPATARKFRHRPATVGLRNSLLGEISAGLLLERWTRDPSAVVHLDHTREGKPYFSNSGMCVSISHSGAVVAVAVAPFNVGIDVQLIRPMRGDFAERFFHQSEIGAWNLSEGGSAVIALWSCKESFAKYDGRGLTATLAEFAIIPDVSNQIPDVSNRSVVVNQRDGSSSGAATVQHHLPGYVLATCAPLDKRHGTPLVISLDQLVEELSR